jgi:hypothetical protein
MRMGLMIDTLHIYLRSKGIIGRLQKMLDNVDKTPG